MTLPKDNSKIIKTKICLDTNILNYIFISDEDFKNLDKSDTSKSINSQSLFDKVVNVEIEFVVPSIALAEYITLASRLYPGIDYTTEVIDLLDSITEISWLTREFIYQIEPVLRNIPYKGADSLIAVTAKYYGCILVTYDKNLRRFLNKDKLAKELKIDVKTPEEVLGMLKGQFKQI